MSPHSPIFDEYERRTDERDQARADLAAVEARNAAALALHKPYYGPPDGPHTLHTVLVYCQDHDGCDGTSDESCDGAEDGHELPACIECQGYSHEHQIETFPLWPCPTARALGGTP